jgi:hypothetical protein
VSARCPLVGRSRKRTRARRDLETLHARSARAGPCVRSMSTSRAAGPDATPPPGRYSEAIRKRLAALPDRQLPWALANCPCQPNSAHPRGVTGLRNRAKSGIGGNRALPSPRRIFRLRQSKRVLDIPMIEGAFLPSVDGRSTGLRRPNDRHYWHMRPDGRRTPERRAGGTRPHR